jgi:short-subunit dehydrogenase
MTTRAALVTGASGGIGLALARMLAEEGHGVTMVARRPEKLEAAAASLTEAGHDVQAVPANLLNEDDILATVAAHRERYRRMDVLVNNAGVGIGAPVHQIEAKRLDMQLDVNIRAMVIYYRECHDMLAAAAEEHGSAHVFNLASIAGKRGQAWLSVYSATKFAVIGFTEAMNAELGQAKIKSCAICPGFVDTDMSEFVKESIPAEEMIKPQDISELARTVMKLSAPTLVPEIVVARAGGPEL